MPLRPMVVLKYSKVLSAPNCASTAALWRLLLEPVPQRSSASVIVVPVVVVLPESVV